MNDKLKSALMAATTLAQGQQAEEQPPVPPEVAVREDGAQPAPQPAIDPRYVEPPGLDSFRQRLASFTVEAPGTVFDVQQLGQDMLARIAALEEALDPFAAQAMVLAQARMNLIVAGRPSEPAGGTWTNGPANIQMKATESLFFNACDVLGRQRTEDAMMQRFKQLQDGMDEVAARDDAGETQH